MLPYNNNPVTPCSMQYPPFVDISMSLQQGTNVPVFCNGPFLAAQPLMPTDYSCTPVYSLPYNSASMQYPSTMNALPLTQCNHLFFFPFLASSFSTANNALPMNPIASHSANSFNPNQSHLYSGMQSLKRPCPKDELDRSKSLSENNAALILCCLGKPVNTFSSLPKSQPVQSFEQSNSLYVSDPHGHVLCSHCFKRNPIHSVTPPSVICCCSCGYQFPVIRRFIHDYNGVPDNDVSLEIPCLRGIVNSTHREVLLHSYITGSLSGRKCGYSTSLRSIQKLLNSLVVRVDRMVSKEQKHIEAECKIILDSLCERAEQYLLGELHCCCFQPFLPQRHFIQCDLCNLWYHTSCVGVDSRKLTSISSFVCPWCTRVDSIKENHEEEESICVCPICKRVFTRPCNLSRHLHAKHKMKWSTHCSLHVNLEDYLEMVPKSKHCYWNEKKMKLFEGCYAVESVLQEYSMTISHFHFLLRKLRCKPSPWWVGKRIRIWDDKQKRMQLAIIKSINHRNGFCISYQNGITYVLSNLFDPSYHIRLLILNGSFELELLHALPAIHPRDVKRDLALFIQ